jgi:ornithine cyclodeaminase
LSQSSDRVRLLRRADVIACLDPERALEAIRHALIASAAGEAATPTPMSFDFRSPRGEAHIKGAHIESEASWTVKVATGFYENTRRGLPTASGMSLVSSAETGLLQTIILDGGHLTDVRTGAAGSVAADALAPQQVERIGVIGCGIQARMQLEYALLSRSPSTVAVYGRNRVAVEEFREEVRNRFGVEAVVAGNPREAVASSQLVFTVTPSETPLVEADWLKPPLAIIAVGSDMPGKNELQPAVLERADVVVADDPAQASRVGELQHSAEAAARAEPLGALLERGGSPGAGIAVADLTGLGAEDAAIAALVAARADELNLGERLALA